MLSMAALAAAIGCGPGVGGTGTGNVYPPDVFGATPAAVCSGALADRLSCGATGVPTPAGTALVVAVDASGRIVARFLGDGVTIEAPCSGLAFVGDWGTRNGEGRYWGTLSRTAVDPGPASATGTPVGRWRLAATGARQRRARLADAGGGATACRRGADGDVFIANQSFASGHQREQAFGQDAQHRLVVG